MIYKKETKRPRDIISAKKCRYNMNNKCAKFQTAHIKYRSTTPICIFKFWNVTIMTWLTYSQTKRPRNMTFDIKVTQYKCKKY